VTLVSPRPARWQILLWALLLALTTGLALRDYDSFQAGTYWDDASYVILAQSIAHGGPYGLSNLPGPPGESRFPFGFPLLLAPAAFLFPNNWEALKLVSLAATLLNITLLFWGWPWLSPGLSRTWGLAAAALYGVARLTIEHTRMVMSEPAFTAVCLLTMLAAEWYLRRPTWLRLLLAGGLLAFLPLVRTVGAVLALGIFLSLWIRRGRALWLDLRPLLAAGALAALVLALNPAWRSSLLPTQYIQDNLTLVSGAGIQDRTPQPYWLRLLYVDRDHLTEQLRQALFSFGGRERELALAARFGLALLPHLIGLGLFAVIAYGFARQVRRGGWTALALGSLAYFVLLNLVLWLDVRLLYPLQAQLTVGFLFGVEGVLLRLKTMPRLSRLPPRLGPGLLAALTAAMLAAHIFFSLRIDDTRWHKGDLAARTAWAAATAPDAVIMTALPEVDYLYSGRHTVPLPGALASMAEREAYLRAQPADYVLIGPDFNVWLTPYQPSYDAAAPGWLDTLDALTRQGRYKRVYASEQDLVQVYQFIK
jgi:hypothetical protein